MSKNSFPVFFTTNSYKLWRQQISTSLGFVPTMGNLHRGHLNLVEEALKEHDCVVISIFVNPTQFGPSEDFDRYPRTLEQDIALLENLMIAHPHKYLVLFAPNQPGEIYGPTFSTSVVPKLWSNILEGQQRPGHFGGVCTVVSILLNIVWPHAMYLGKKDYQQLQIINSMMKDLHFPSKLVAVPTVRDDQGLALSSRNSFLSSDEKIIAYHFPKTLNTLVSELNQIWSADHRWNENEIQKLFNLHKNQSKLNWDYLELRQQDFNELQQDSDKLVLLGAVRVGSVRLLDNVEFDIKK